MPEMKQVAGTVLRVEDDIVVIAFKDPLDGKKREMDVPKDKVKGDCIKKGDTVLVELFKETKIPMDGSMLEIEEAIQNALEQMKTEVSKTGEPRVSARIV